MTTRGTLSRLSAGLVLCWVSLLCGAADLNPFPWHGDNAVVAVPGSIYGKRGREGWLSGSLTRASTREDNFYVSFSDSPENWSSLSLASRGDKALEVFWLYRRSKSDSAGMPSPFRAIFAQRASANNYQPLRTISNLVAGPIWALVVDPELDKYELPTNSPAVYDRVRILPLDFTAQGWTSPGWIIGKAIDAHPYFCGLPRALAHLLSATSTDKGGAPPVFGLVLIPLKHAPEVTKPEFSISHLQMEDTYDDSPFLSLLVAQAKATRSANGLGVDDRDKRRRIRHARKQLDLKREGIVEPDIADSPVRWTLCHPGDLSTLPFRVHALIR